MASFLQVEAESIAIHRYWRLDWNPDPARDERAAMTGVRERLETAVRARLVADVPLGAFLSGGVDSTAVVWLMRQAGTEPLKTFSIGFDEARYDELPYARQVASAFGTEHYEQVVKPD